MRRMTILADDLTGAMDTGAFPACCGQPVTVVTEPAAMREEGGAVVSVNTDTRRSGRDEARAVYARLCEGWSAQDGILFKKIDMGFRGNTPAEIDGCMQGGGFDLCFLVPSIPDFNTFTCGGMQHVKGELLTRSLYKDDPSHRPVDDYVPRIMENGGCSLPSAVILGGTVEQIRWAVDDAVQDGARVLIFDSESNDDCARIVEALLERFPGALWAGTLGLMRAMSIHLFGPLVEDRPPDGGTRCFCLCGSAYGVTKGQIEQVSGHCSVTRVTAHISDYLDADPERYLADLVRRCLAVEGHLLLTPFVPPEREQPGLDAEILQLLTRCGAAVCREMLPERLVVVGGDTAGRLLKLLGTRRLQIDARPETGLAEGMLLDGVLAGRQFAAKGGSVGSVHALERLMCLRMDGGG